MKEKIRSLTPFLAVVFVLPVMAAAALSVAGCTENTRARAWGGKQDIEIPCDQRVIDVTWKGADLWVATRPMEPHESPVTVTFTEDSSWGAFEGTVTFSESRCR